MNRNKKQNNREVITMLSLISQIGITILTTVFMCLAIGLLLDYFLGTHLLIIFIILGVLASFKSVYMLLVKVGVITNTSTDSQNAQSLDEEDDDETENP